MRLRRSAERGAISVVVGLAALLLLLVLAAASVGGGAEAAAEHAQSAADSVAHAAAVATNGMERRDDLSIEVQAGRLCWWGDGRPDGYVAADDDLCSPLEDAARAMASANGVVLVRLLVGPDIRDQADPAPRPGRLAVLATVRGDGPLVRSAAVCGHGGDVAQSGVCMPLADSAAEAVLPVMRSAGRDAAVRCMLDRARDPAPPVSDAGYPDVIGILACLNAGGDTDTPGGAPAARLQALLATCAPIPAPGASPGDLVQYMDPAAGPRWRLAMVAADGDGVAWFAGGFHRVHLAEIASGGPIPGDPIHASTGTITYLRVSPQTWPGSADVSQVPGRIALVDAGVMAGRLQWSALHPRDADTSFWHTLTSPYASMVALLSYVVHGAVNVLIGLVHALLEALPLHLGAPLLALFGLLAWRFDGSWLHRGLTVLLLALVAWPLALVAVASQLPGFRSIPVLRSVGGALWEMGSFVVSNLTGVDDGRTSLLSVVAALVTMPFLWARSGIALLRIGARFGAWVPWSGRLAAAWARVGGWGERWSGAAWRALEPLSRWGNGVTDIVVLRPSNWIRLLWRGGDHGLAAVAPGSAAAVRRSVELGAADIASLPWHPAGTVDELLTRLSRGMEWTARGLRTGGHGWPFDGYHEVVDRFPALARAADAEVARFQAGAVRVAGDLSRAANLHQGAVSVATVAGGDAPAPVPFPDRVVRQQLGRLRGW